jgi:undecaprenyl-diphosphatase
MNAPVYTRRVGDGHTDLLARRATHRMKRTAELVRSAWRTPTQRRLGLALVFAALSATAFARIAEDYLTNDPLARWDIRFARWLASERSGVGIDFFRVLTFIGSPAAAFAIVALVSIALYRRRKLVEAALLLVVTGGGELLNLVLKVMFHRARPEVAFVHLDTYSFPSGHAMLSTAAYGALAYLAWGHLRTPRRRIALIVGTTVLVALICFSRLYLGVHYLSDVLGGAAGGTFWLAVAIAISTIYGESLARRFAGSSLDRLGRRLTRS